MISTTIGSLMFGKAAATLFVVGIAALPIAVKQDCNKDRTEMPATGAATVAATLGVVGEWLFLIAHCL